MLATYGVDVHSPATSLRRMHVLLRRLPPGSVPAADSPAAWSTEAHLLAHLLDQTAALTWVTLRANGAKPAKPRPIPRPGATTARTRPRLSWGQLGGALAGQPGIVAKGPADGR